MRLAEHSVPKMDPQEERYGGGLVFGAVEEAAQAFRARVGGKLLFVSDEKSYERLAFAARLNGAVNLVFEEDALPLFSMPDGVGGVFAAGGEKVMTAARLFAQVRRTPCMLAPASASLDGVFSDRAEVSVGGSKIAFPLKKAQTVCDLSLLQPSLAEGYARLLLARLSVFEMRALRAIAGRGEPSEEVAKICSALPREAEGEEIVRRNAAVREAENGGAPCGEGVRLAAMYGIDGCFRAFDALSALYFAFFKRGEPRTVVPDYASRSAFAGKTILPPTAEEDARRRKAFAVHRGGLLRELEALTAESARERRIYTQLAGHIPAKPSLSQLYLLPDAETEGLSAVIRDFGFLEKS